MSSYGPSSGQRETGYGPLLHWVAGGDILENGPSSTNTLEKSSTNTLDERTATQRMHLAALGLALASHKNPIERQKSSVSTIYTHVQMTKSAVGNKF